MKKYIALFLALIMSLSLCACGTSNTTSSKATDDNGSLNAPNISDSTKEDKGTTVDSEDPADLSNGREVLSCFKKTEVCDTSTMLGGILADYASYTDDTMPTYESVFDNMLTDAEYGYDEESTSISVTGDMDVASLRTLMKFTCYIDDYDPFQGYDTLAFDGCWYVYKINSTTNGIEGGASIAIADTYGEDFDYWWDVIIVCSEMKNGHIDWDSAYDIMDAYMQACSYLD